MTDDRKRSEGDVSEQWFLLWRGKVDNMFPCKNLTTIFFQEKYNTQIFSKQYYGIQKLPEVPLLRIPELEDK